MKSLTEHVFLVVVFSLCLFATTPLHAQQAEAKKRIAFPGMQTDASDKNPIKLKSKDAKKADLASAVSHCDLADVEMKDGKTYTRIEVPGVVSPNAVGEPEQPFREELIRIPAGAKISLNVENVSWHEIEGEVELPPVQEPLPDVRGLNGETPDKDMPFTKDAEAYNADAYSNETPILLGDRVKIRGREYVRVIYRPVSYNPVQKKARIAYDVKWCLDVVPPKKAQHCRPDKFGAQVKDSIDIRSEEQVEAEEPADASMTDGEPHPDLTSSAANADYLIITPDNFAEEVAPLAAWKHKKGYKTYVATLTEVGGATQTNIKTYIQNAYDTGTMTTYVLLVGDHENLPGYKITGHPYHGSSHEWHIDYPYSLLEGGDNYPDIYIARLPGDTEAQITTMVNKSITYDKTPDTGSWYDDVLTAGQFQDSDDSNNIADRCFMEDLHQISDFLGPDYDFYGSHNGLSEINKGYTIHTALQWDSPTTNNLQYCNYSYVGKRSPPTVVPDSWKAMGSGTATQVSSAINGGVAMVFHRDHGYSGTSTGGEGWADPDYQASHINSLTNGNKLPFVFSLNCATGWFDGCDKFAEAWLRKANGGAVGYTGAARVSYSGYNDCYHMGIMDTLWDDYSTYDDGVSIPYPNSWRPAETIVRAKGFVFAGYGATNTYAVLTAQFFNWFGDPELQLRTETPIQLAASHPASLTKEQLVSSPQQLLSSVFRQPASLRLRQPATAPHRKASL